MKYLVSVFDIKEIAHPIKLKEFVIENIESKCEAMDQAHCRAELLYPNVIRMIDVRQINFY